MPGSGLGARVPAGIRTDILSSVELTVFPGRLKFSRVCSSVIGKVAFQCPGGSMIEESFPDKNRNNDDKDDDDDNDGLHPLFEKVRAFSTIIPFKEC